MLGNRSRAADGVVVPCMYSRTDGTAAAFTRHVEMWTAAKTEVAEAFMTFIQLDEAFVTRSLGSRIFRMPVVGIHLHAALWTLLPVFWESFWHLYFLIV